VFAPIIPNEEEDPSTVRDVHDLLTHVPASKQANERVLCAFETLGNVVLVLDLAAREPAGHFTVEDGVVHGLLVGDDETLHGNRLA
jgi:hypothetical protein